MIGPDHYRAAEGLLRAVRVLHPDGNSDLLIAAAQVHATLALASATALGIEPTPEGLELWDDMIMHPLDIDEDTAPDDSQDRYPEPYPGEMDDNRCAAATDTHAETLECLLPEGHDGWHKALGASWSGPL